MKPSVCELALICKLPMYLIFCMGVNLMKLFLKKLKSSFQRKT
jgi:hypothetical protein